MSAISPEAAATRLAQLYARYGAAFLQGLARATEERQGFVYRLTEVLHYLPLPQQEYLYFAVRAAPSGQIAVQGPLMKDMYGRQRVFRPLRPEEVEEGRDVAALLAEGLRGLLDALARLGYQ